MRRDLGIGLSSITLGLVLLGLLVVPAVALEDSDPGIGFILRSEDFAAPCTMDVPEVPRIYDNGTATAVDVSIKVVNTGSANVFVVGTGYVIPPIGPIRRPRIMRVTVPPGGSLGLAAQGPPCSWLAVIRPH
jgi:hypothetical protein